MDEKSATATGLSPYELEQQAGRPPKTKKCPFCAEDIQDAAVFCKHCKRDLPSTVTSSDVAAKRKTRPLIRIGMAVLGVFGVFALAFIASVIDGASRGPLTQEQRDAALQSLKSKGLTLPTSLEISSAGFVVAEYELPDAYVAQLAIPLRRFAEMRLLAIREGLLPHGYEYYRVNINGPRPGTGLVRRYGAARYAGGSVEWVTP